MEFTYEALTPNGAVTRGALEAADEAEVENLLRARGEFLIRAQPQPAASAPESPDKSRLDGKLSRRDLLALTEYLWGSVRAGIPILTTLEDVELHLESKRLRAIVASVRADMTEEGKSLSEGLAAFPRAFSQLYVSTIEAGERTGQLEYVLEQLVDYLEWQQEIALQIRQATMYPIIVLLVTGGLIVLLVTFVYPRLLPIFTGFQVELPLPTRMVMGMGDFFRNQWHVPVLIVAGIVLLWGMLKSWARGRLVLDSLKLKLPVFGPVLHQIEMSRVVTYMALFYRTGIDLLRGLDLLERIVSNRRISMVVGEARERISGGESIAQAFQRSGLFPHVVIRSFALGESTGKLDESLDRARLYYAREVPAAVKRMLAAFQPLLTILLGIIIGVVALSIFMPLMSVYQAVSR